MKKLLLLFFVCVGVVVWASRAEINTQTENQKRKESFIGQITLLDPSTSQGYGVVVPRGGEVDIEFPFDSPTETSGFSVLFPGNLDSVSSLHPKDFTVFYESSDGEWIKSEEKSGYRKRDYQLTLPENTLVKGYKLRVTRAAFFDMVRLTDTKFYRTEKISFAQFVLDSLDTWKKSYVAYFLYTTVILLFLFVPGYWLLDIGSKKFSWNLSTEHKVVIGFLPPLLFLATLTIFAIITRSNLWYYLYLPLLIVSASEFVRRKGYLQIVSEAKWLLLLFALVLFAVNTLQAKRDFLFNLDYIEKYIDGLPYVPLAGYYGYHADNTLQWGIARGFLHHVPVFSQEADKYRLGVNGNYVFDRTPLLPLITSPVLFYFGESHFTYQRLLNILMTLLYVAIFVLLSKLFSRWTARVVLLLLILSGPVTFQLFNTETYLKTFSYVPVVIGLIIYFDENIKVARRNLLLGLLLGLAYLAHPSTLFLSVLILPVLLFRYKFSKNFLAKTLTVFTPILIAFALWAGISYYVKNFSSGNVVSRSAIFTSYLAESEDNSFMNRLLNVANIFIPDILNKFKNYGDFHSVDYYIYRFQRSSLVTAVTPLFLVGVFLILFRRRTRQKYWIPLLFGFGPLVLFLIIIHHYSSAIYTVFYPFFLPFLFGIVVNELRPVNKYFRGGILFSFPFFTLPYLYYLSGMFDLLKYDSLVSLALFILSITSYLIPCWLLYRENGSSEEHSFVSQLIKKIKKVN